MGYRWNIDCALESFLWKQGIVVRSSGAGCWFGDCVLGDEEEVDRLVHGWKCVGQDDELLIAEKRGGNTAQRATEKRLVFIGDSFDAIGQPWNIEIDEQAYSDIQKFDMGQCLHKVDLIQCFDGFNFNNDFLFH